YGRHAHRSGVSAGQHVRATSAIGRSMGALLRVRRHGSRCGGTASQHDSVVTTPDYPIGEIVNVKPISTESTDGTLCCTMRGFPQQLSLKSSTPKNAWIKLT